MNVRLTRRGWAIAAVAVGAVAMATSFGARALNAVVVPCLVVLVAGCVGVYRTGRPRIERSRPAPGFPGETRTVTLAVETDVPTVATVRDTGATGLTITTGTAGGDEAVETTLPNDLEYECRLETRGEHALGPAVVAVRDLLGVLEREFRITDHTDVLVYPPVRTLAGTVRYELGGLDTTLVEREAFDRLREYVPGDPLRDVHWKSSAKRDGFVVTEFAAEDDEDGVSVVAEAAPGRADEMASAAASVACWLLDKGIEVEFVAPSGRTGRAGGPAQRERVLGLLARTAAGRVDVASREEADVVIAAASDGTVSVRIDGREIPFEGLYADRTNSPDALGTAGATSAVADGGFEEGS